MSRSQITNSNGGKGTCEGSGKEAARAIVAKRVGRLLGARYWPVVLALLGVLVSLPALGTGLLTDDYPQRAMLLGPSQMTEPLSEVGLAPEGSGRMGPVLSDLFVAVQPGRNLEALRDYGALPWWTHDGYRVAFWRPVASFTHWLDHRLFPDSLVLMHLHSVLWFAAVVLVIASLYHRCMMVGWIAGLAALMFVLDDSSYFPTMWLANRNLLMSLFFGGLTLLAHDRWRRGRSKAGAVLAPVCLLVSLLCAEAGVATFAYLFAHAVALDEGRRLRRVAALGPALAVLVLWRLLYNLQDYGASGGGFYFDPVREPLAFAVTVLRRGPFMLGGQWTTVPPDLYSFLPAGTKLTLWLVLGALTISVPALLWPLLRTSRTARFWWLGMYGSVLPFCATVPMSRSLPFVAVGAFGVIAECLAGWFRKDDWLPTTSWIRGTVRNVVVIFILGHIALALVTRVFAARVTSKLQSRVARTMAIGLRERRLDQDLVIVNAPNPTSFLYDPYAVAFAGKSLPRAVRVLAPGYGPVAVTRTGPRQVVIRSTADSLLDCERGRRMDFVFFYRYLSDVRGPGHPLRVGDRITLPRMTVDVLDVDERGLPVEVACEFETKLEDRALRWLYWNWDREHYVTFGVPPVGATIQLDGPF
jgi:hypothetical protein